MPDKSDATPENHHSAIPMLAVHDAAGAIEFYKQAFGATESQERIIGPDGKIGHAEISIGTAPIMIADEFPEHNRSPQTLGGTSVILFLYVEDVDALAGRAIAAGARLVRPAEDAPFGRLYKLQDPYGHVWMFATPW